MPRQHRSAFHTIVNAVALAAFAGCGGPDRTPAACAGVESNGICWVAKDGITLTKDRVDRLFATAVAVWGVRDPELPGWRVEFSLERAVIDGEEYDGYTWGHARYIVVAPFVPDCFERSAIIHELGHAWGFGHDDPRMWAQWRHIREAMDRSGWPGCLVGSGHDEGSGRLD
jgi:hypothetical protein